MANFAELDENNVVIRVIAVRNDVILDENGQESEAKGIAFLRSLFGGGRWVQTSINHNFRNVAASVGGRYDEARDAFIARQPYPSWSLNETTLQWEPPMPMPNDGKHYVWREDLVSWFATGLELNS